MPNFELVYHLKQTVLIAIYRNSNGISACDLKGYENMQDMMMSEYEYSNLLTTLSTKYCLCEFLDGFVDYSSLYTNFCEVSSLLCDVPHMRQARNNLSTLIIPKPSQVKA